MDRQKECPVCKSLSYCSPNYENFMVFYDCPVCGRFELGEYEKRVNFDYNHLASYLVYNCFHSENYDEYRYHTVMDKEKCDQYRQEFDKGNNVSGRPVHIDADIVENWYPKTFSEKVDRILLYINNKTRHVGQRITMGFRELMAVLFVDQSEMVQNGYSQKKKWREEDDCDTEAKFMLDYLVKCEYITYEDGTNEDAWIELSLTPEGYGRVDILQKNTSYGRNALVAMKFGDDTKNLREAIRKGVAEAGYIAIFIDEVQHNDFITPELLKHIRDSKFVVVDLTHQNNGAYFEEGYAMGLGKPVIQLCQQDTKLHFDIAQKNTIMWGVEDDIPERLKNRIKATID
jgi:hypothetical protein